MQKAILLITMLCALSTQVLGSVAHGDEHSAHDDLHGFMHEIGQPHTHDHENKSNFTLSFTDEAVEHINEDLECCILGLLEKSPIDSSERNPISAINAYATNWNPPYLKYIKPPPKL